MAAAGSINAVSGATTAGAEATSDELAGDAHRAGHCPCRIGGGARGHLGQAYPAGLESRCCVHSQGDLAGHAYRAVQVGVEGVIADLLAEAGQSAFLGRCYFGYVQAGDDGDVDLIGYQRRQCDVRRGHHVALHPQLLARYPAAAGAVSALEMDRPS